MSGFNLLDDEYFTIPFVTDTIPNSPAGHQVPTQAKQNVWIISIDVEETITAQGALDEINRHQTPHGKSKFHISICRKRATIENILKIFVPDLIKSDLWFRILKLVSQKNLPPKRKLVKV